MFLLLEKFVPALHKMPDILRRVYVLLVVVVGFVLFNAQDLSQALSDIGGMFGFGGVPLVTQQTFYYLRSYGVLLIAACVGATPVVRRVAAKLENTYVAVLEPALLVLLLLVCSAYLVDGSFNPFLYFRF